MISDKEVSDWNQQWHPTENLRNLTPQQWREIEAALPSEPRRSDSFRFLEAVNRYRDYVARTPPRTYARRVTKALTLLRAAMDTLHAAGPMERDDARTGILSRLSTVHRALGWHADLVREAIEPHTNRHVFLAEALWYWRECEGSITFSRLPVPPRTPTGPLIRYLKCVCKIVMGDKAPATETLAAFICTWKRGVLL